MGVLNVLITGATGQIGRRLVPALLAHGHRVVASYRKPVVREGHGFSVIGDLNELRVREEAFSQLTRGGTKNCAVIHLAGLADAGRAREERKEAFRSNTCLTMQLLDACVVFGVRQFLLASTGLVYPTLGLAPRREDALVAPHTVYAATKLAAEFVVQGYAREWSMSCEIFRLSNVYGPDSPENTVVGRILGQLRRGEPVAVMAREPVRDFIYVDDAVEAIRSLLEDNAGPGCRLVNISSGKGVSIGELADIAGALAQGETSPKAIYPEVEDCLVLSNEVLQKRVGWKPRFSLAEGLRASLAPHS